MNYDARWGYYAPSDRGGVNPTQQMAAIAANRASGWSGVSNDPRSGQSPAIRSAAQRNAVAQAPSAQAVDPWTAPELLDGNFQSEADYKDWASALTGAQANMAAIGAPRDPRQPLDVDAGIHQSRLDNRGAAYQFGVKQGWLEEDPDFGSWKHFTGSVLPYLAIAAPAIMGIAGAGLASSAAGPAPGAVAGAGTTFGAPAAVAAPAASNIAAIGARVADPVLASGAAPVSQPWQAPFYNPGAAAPTASSLTGMQALEAGGVLGAGGAAASGIDYGLNTGVDSVPGPVSPDPMYSFGEGSTQFGLNPTAAGLGFTASPAAFASFGAGPAAASFSVPSLFSGLGSSDWLSIAGGAYGIYSSEEQRKLAKQAAQMQDPFGPQRAQYASQLAKLNADPNSVTSLPGYQFGMDQGTQALLRTQAATGYTGSGNEAIALQKFGQEYAGNYLRSEQDRLAQLAGAQFSPSGGNALLQGNSTADEILRMSLASIGYGLGGRGRVS